MMQSLIQLSWLIPIYGFLGVLLSLPWSTGMVQRTGPRPAVYINLFMTAIAFIHGTFVFMGIWNVGGIELQVPWLQVADLSLSFDLDLSVLNLGVMELSTGLTLLAQIYGLGYMEKEWALARFFSLMGFFEGAVNGVLLSSSFFLAYFLLETLTLSTYLIVGFWYAQPLVVKAARDAFLTKRVGDILLLMGVLGLSSWAGDLHYNEMYEWVKHADLQPLAATLLGLALIAGPTGKCAQFPLHLWLDEAMEGPSPASILRNSVVVTCGAYVLIKLQPVVVVSPVALTALIAIGTTTAVGASLVAIAQVDLKRALSYSTSAYIGLVFIAVGAEWPGVAIGLLFTHAVAKALMFMSTGAIINNTSCQNMTELGGIWSRMPATTIAFVVGGAGMVGVLPLGGFWSLQLGVDFLRREHPVLAGIFLLVNALTVFNLVRVFRLVFLGKPTPKTRRSPEANWLMSTPMIALSIFVVLLPFCLMHMSLLPPLRYWHPWVFGALIASGVLGLVLGCTATLSRSLLRSTQRSMRVMQDLLANDFYTEELYRVTVVFVVRQFSRIVSWFDRYVVDGAVNLVGMVSLMSGEGLKYSISGQSQGYIFTIVVGVSLLGFLMTWAMW
ncbi:NAD(P)H-quinone oxidoreductase subunit F [Leptothoe spongobia]|uniref:NAD(P)H-quinone oxidoreductase subunit F n=1 Tax=Leptothoe spongobia TAU-MAC 1115 TaxID=1967444 RepID=A0A947DHU3_9CYAN|nr:NAD(P)H-quinone oxidoreductase subunit F [Leptothoe spongobia]MBT9317452.1 NAD(P)H-quinone oxidoreductase subunit F [Leptothoe spongobia TAU-MAC 1115]